MVPLFVPVNVTCVCSSFPCPSIFWECLFSFQQFRRDMILVFIAFGVLYTSWVYSLMSLCLKNPWPLSIRYFYLYILSFFWDSLSCFHLYSFLHELRESVSSTIFDTVFFITVISIWFFLTVFLSAPCFSLFIHVVHMLL